MPKLHFTKRAIEALPFAERGQKLYRDTAMRGLGVRVGANSKVFFVEGQVSGRTRRVTIGRADVLNVEEARRRALTVLSEMAGGVDPNQEKRRVAHEAISLGHAFDRFFETRSTMAASSVDRYRRSCNLYLRDWKRSPITSITRQMILKRHQRIAKDHGQVTANTVMRHLRSVYNVTAAAFDEFPPNPVAILTQARAWFPERRRRGAVAVHDLPAWWEAVMTEPHYSRDFLLLAVFTGMRRSEIASLRWDYINLAEGTLHIPKTKNGDPLDLPLAAFIVDLLKARRAWTGASPWVFPSNGKTGHIVETKKFTARVAARSGVQFTLHDLRRTFITIAESLDIPHYALKRLLNHRLSGDVTAGYIVSQPERLRRPVEVVANRIFELKGIPVEKVGVA
ncbi:tyrosine-type recombinase/integrase [Boseongicola aestuarii]|uniref:Phage integrase family protein n=1 Tax=Boseongicola aestuarii TaxID=1470561 RepID=A0A238J2T3_9RHOB|nr:integrase family protein [Boseongicola aestuarii]SMX25039.1 Phage integrase family protein [Boseongicola aestuarii]